MPSAIKKTCKECATSVTPVQRPGIGCCNCLSFFHFICAQLQDKDIKYIESNPVGWLCPKCNKPHRRSSIIPATPSKDFQKNEPVPGTSKGIPQKAGRSLAKTANKKITNTTTVTPSASLPTNFINKSPGKKPSQKPSGRLSSLVKTAPSANSFYNSSESTTQLLNSNSILTDIEKINQQLKDLQDKIDELQLTVGRKEQRIDDLERQNTLKKIEIQGLACGAALNPLLILKRIGEEINCRLVPNDIISANFLTTKDNRVNLVAEFVSELKKESFIIAGRRFKREGGKLSDEPNGSRVFINQLLTTKDTSLQHYTDRSS